MAPRNQGLASAKVADILTNCKTENFAKGYYYCWYVKFYATFYNFMLTKTIFKINSLQENFLPILIY